MSNVGPVRHRAIDSSELRLTTDLEAAKSQMGQHRSHIAATPYFFVFVKDTSSKPRPASVYSCAA